MMGGNGKTMTWYIDANAKIRAEVYDGATETWGVEEITVADALDAYTEDGCPAPADVEKIKHGEWEDNKVAFYRMCSECGCGVRSRRDVVLLNFIDHQYYYCPNCGAKMDGGRGPHETI